MRVWGKTQEPSKQAPGVARAALAGKARKELLREAVRTVLASGQADRVGVWVESAEDALGGEGQATFRGIVGEKEGHATPIEWSRLLPGPPLPGELLVGLQTVEQELDESAALMIGALIEMHRALWVPVVIHGHLRGVLYVGHRKKQTMCRACSANRSRPNLP